MPYGCWQPIYQAVAYTCIIMHGIISYLGTSVQDLCQRKHTCDGFKERMARGESGKGRRTERERMMGVWRRRRGAREVRGEGRGGRREGRGGAEERAGGRRMRQPILTMSFTRQPKRRYLNFSIAFKTAMSWLVIVSLRIAWLAGIQGILCKNANLILRQFPRSTEAFSKCDKPSIAIQDINQLDLRGRELLMCLCDLQKMVCPWKRKPVAQLHLPQEDPKPKHDHVNLPSLPT